MQNNLIRNIAFLFFFKYSLFLFITKILKMHVTKAKIIWPRDKCVKNDFGE